MTCGFVIFFTYSRRGTCAAAQSIWSQTVAAVASPGMEPSEQSFVTNVTIRTPFTHSKFGNTCNSTGWLTGRNCAGQKCNRFDNITPFTHSKLANTCNCSSEPLKLCPIPLKVYSNTKKCNQCDYNSFLTFKVWKHVQLFPCWQAEPRYCQLVSSSDCYFHLFLIPQKPRRLCCPAEPAE